MMYFRELPLPLKELDGAFVDVFFNFANTYTEESVLYAEAKHRKEMESSPTADLFREMGYSEKEIAEMDI